MQGFGGDPWFTAHRTGARPKNSALHGAHGQAVLSKQQKKHDEEPKMIMVGSNHQNINPRVLDSKKKWVSSCTRNLAINRAFFSVKPALELDFCDQKLVTNFPMAAGEDYNSSRYLAYGSPLHILDEGWTFADSTSLQVFSVWRLGPHLLVRKSTSNQSVDPLEKCISIVGGFLPLIWKISPWNWIICPRIFETTT